MNTYIYFVVYQATVPTTKEGNRIVGNIEVSSPSSVTSIADVYEMEKKIQSANGLLKDVVITNYKFLRLEPTKVSVIDEN